MHTSICIARLRYSHAWCATSHHLATLFWWSPPFPPHHFLQREKLPSDNPRLNPKCCCSFSSFQTCTGLSIPWEVSTGLQRAWGLMRDGRSIWVSGCIRVSMCAWEKNPQAAVLQIVLEHLPSQPHRHLHQGTRNRVAGALFCVGAAYRACPSGILNGWYGTWCGFCFTAPCGGTLLNFLLDNTDNSRSFSKRSRSTVWRTFRGRLTGGRGP
mmetsp:Transcript_8699/g.13311  ORF Transcript_8699/g.13311 Transcript_8699/m.13311 type:complete len:212 (+) Transcript_8699:1524-2159(+)